MRKKNLPFLDEDWKEDFLEYVEKGYFINVICKLKGIKPSTFKTWEKKALLENDEKYIPFIAQVHRKEAIVEARMTDVLVTDAYEGNVKTTLEYLKKRFKDNWSDSKDINISQGEDNVFKIVTKTKEEVKKEREKKEKELNANRMGNESETS